MKLKIADYVSLVSLFLAWVSLFLILNNEPYLAIVSSCLAIFIDTIDGYVARRLKQDSELGTHLDSAIDILNYIIFSSLFSHYYIFDNFYLGFVTGFVIWMFGVLRLVRLNQTGIKVDGEKKYYEGVVVTHISIVVILLFFAKLILGFNIELISFLILNSLGVLMISKIRTYKPKLPILLYAFLIASSSVSIWLYFNP